MHTQWMRGVHVAVHVQPVSTTIQQVEKKRCIPFSLTDENAYTIHMCLLDSQFPSTCQQTPRCEPDAVLALELPMVVKIADEIPMLP